MAVRTVITAVSLLIASACTGTPSRLVVGNADTVAVSNYRPVRLPVRVFDDAGHVLKATGVRYRWSSGVPVPVSAFGTVQCTESGDATVRATLGGATTSVLLRCRPVSKLHTSGGMEFVLGDSAQPLPVEALGLDGRRVAEFAGTAYNMDSTIITLDGLRVRPRSPGQTMVTVTVGNIATSVGVTVYERVRTLEGLRPQQRHVVVPVRLASGEEHRWRVAAGRYVVFVRNDRTAHPGLRLAILGANCVHVPWSEEHHFFCEAATAATAIVYHPWNAVPAPALTGELGVNRVDP